jgi:hypothetical protein
MGCFLPLGTQWQVFMIQPPTRNTSETRPTISTGSSARLAAIPTPDGSTQIGLRCVGRCEQAGRTKIGGDALLGVERIRACGGLRAADGGKVVADLGAEIASCRDRSGAVARVRPWRRCRRRRGTRAEEKSEDAEELFHAATLSQSHTVTICTADLNQFTSPCQ